MLYVFIPIVNYKVIQSNTKAKEKCSIGMYFFDEKSFIKKQIIMLMSYF